MSNASDEHADLRHALEALLRPRTSTRSRTPTGVCSSVTAVGRRRGTFADTEACCSISQSATTKAPNHRKHEPPSPRGNTS
jgi:hypothetical protein